MLCLTPWPGQFNRYLIPIVPLLALSLCTSIACGCFEGFGRAVLPLARWGGLVHCLFASCGNLLRQQVATTVAVYTQRHLELRAL